MVLNRIGVTGASGMMGRHVIDECRLRGWQVVATSRNTRELAGACHDCFEWDLRQWKNVEELDAAFGPIDAVVHAGALVPKLGQMPSQPDLFDGNVRATLCLARFALGRGVPMVFLSGATVYCDPYAKKIAEGARKQPRTAPLNYGFSKLLAEDVLAPLAGEGLALTVLRPSSIYGEGQSSDKLLPQFLASAGRGQAIRLSEPTDDRINFIHAADVARAALDSLESGSRGVFNVGGKHNVTIAECAEACLRVTGRGIIHVDRGERPRRPQTQFDLDSSAAKSHWGFEAAVDLSEGLGRIWRHMQSNRSVPEGYMPHE